MWQDRAPKMEEHIHLISEIVDEKLKSSLAEHKNAMLHDLERIVEKISSKTNVTELTQISNIVSGVPPFKRKSGEEQFKHNAKVIGIRGSRKCVVESKY